MNLGSMFPTWLRVISSPNEMTFQQEKNRPEATFGTALVWRIIAILITTALSYIGAVLGMSGVQAMLVSMEQQMATLPPEARQAFEQVMALYTPQNIGFLSIGGIFVSIIMFIILCILFHLIARMLGGQGNLGSFAFLSANVWSPIEIIAGVLNLVPVLGGCISIFVWIYGLVLSFFAIKANYQLGDGKAIAVIILPFVLIIALVFCGAIAIAGLAAASQQ